MAISLSIAGVGPASPPRARIAQVLTALAAALLVATQLNPDHFPPWTSYHSEAPAFLAGALLLLATAVRGAPRVSAPVLVLLALAASAWLQCASGLVRYAGDAWVATAYLGVFAAAWWWASQDRAADETPPTLDLVIGCLWAIGLIGAFQAIAQWMQVENAFGGWLYAPAGTTRSTGNVGQPNQLGTLILMATAASATWIVRGRVGLKTAWAWLLLAGAAIVLTQSRTALLSAVVMVVALAAASAFRPALRRWNKHAVLWLAWIAMATAVLQTTEWEWARRALGTDAMARVGLRPIIWAQMLDALQQQPWTGYGWLQVSAAQQVGAAHVPGVEQVNYAHNVPLEVLVALGVPLGALVIVAAATWGVRRLIRLRDDDGSAFAACMMLLPWLVHAQLELPHAYSYFLVLVGMLFGVLEARTRRGGDWALRIPAWAGAVAATAYLSMLAALAYEYATVEEDLRVNRFENRRLGQTPAGYAYPELQLLTQQGELLHAMRLRATPGMPAQDVDLLVRVAGRFTWAPLQFRAALALALNGRPAEARQRLLVLRNLFDADTVQEGRDNWRQLQQDQYPVLAAVPFP